MLTIKKNLRTISLLVISLLMVSCNEPASSTENSEIANHTQSTSTNNSLFVLTVTKNPSCGCCGKWLEHMSENGFKTIVHNSNDLSKFKLDLGIKPNFQSCHTAVSNDGFVFEGHVPAKYVKQFLVAPPKNAIGLTVPGMVAGSPGMEMGNKFSPYKIWLIKKDGSLVQYAKIDSYQEQL